MLKALVMFTAYKALIFKIMYWIWKSTRKNIWDGLERGNGGEKRYHCKLKNQRKKEICVGTCKSAQPNNCQFKDILNLGLKT